MTESIDIPSMQPGESIPAPIEELPYFKVRVDILTGRLPSGSRLHAEDRTTSLVKQYLELKNAIKQQRMASLSLCEARPGKGVFAQLTILDRPAFDDLQKAIEENQSKLDTLSSVIRKLEEGSYGWYNDLQEQVARWSSTQDELSARLNQFAARIISRDSREGKEPQALLEQDGDYQAAVQECAKETAEAKQRHKILSERLQEMQDILDEAGV